MVQRANALTLMNAKLENILAMSTLSAPTPSLVILVNVIMAMKVMVLKETAMTLMNASQVLTTVTKLQNAKTQQVALNARAKMAIKVVIA